MAISFRLNGVRHTLTDKDWFRLEYEILMKPVMANVQELATDGMFVWMKAKSGQIFKIPWGDIGTRGRAVKVRPEPEPARAGKGEG